MSNEHLLAPLPHIELGLYMHYKNLPYEVMGVVRHSESCEPMVLYKPLYGEGAMWVRPFAMFVEQVKIDGVMRPRFAKVPG